MFVYDRSYPPIMNASGARGFFMEGYWYHSPWRYAGLTFDNCGFTAKTTTMQPRLDPHDKLGNMHMLLDGITPRDCFPSCIIVKPISGVALNAVSLSGPGAYDLLNRGIWQQIIGQPWNMSFMSLCKTKSERMNELREFIRLLVPVVHKFNAPVGLELNFSCPNTHVNPNELIEETGEALDMAAPICIPLICKYNALAPVETIFEISRNINFHALVMGNTIPWGQLPDTIPWAALFGSEESPLKQFGGGGLSGPPLRRIHCGWIREAREYGLKKPIWGCGGIDSPKAVQEYHDAGANGVQIGTVCITRPWRMKRIIATAKELFH